VRKQIGKFSVGCTGVLKGASLTAWLTAEPGLLPCAPSSVLIGNGVAERLRKENEQGKT